MLGIIRIQISTRQRRQTNSQAGTQKGTHTNARSYSGYSLVKDTVLSWAQVIQETLLLCGLKCLFNVNPCPSHNLMSSPAEAKQKSPITMEINNNQVLHIYLQIFDTINEWMLGLFHRNVSSTLRNMKNRFHLVWTVNHEGFYPDYTLHHLDLFSLWLLATHLGPILEKLRVGTILNCVMSCVIFSFILQ